MSDHSDAQDRATAICSAIWEYSGLTLHRLVPLATGVTSIATLDRYLKGIGKFPMMAVRSICAFGDGLLTLPGGSLYRYVCDGKSTFDFDVNRFVTATFHRPTRDDLGRLRNLIQSGERRRLPRYELADAPQLERRGSTVQAALLKYDTSRYPASSHSSNDIISIFDRALLSAWIEDADPVATTFAMTASGVRHLSQGLGWCRGLSEDDRAEQLEWLIDALEDRDRQVCLINDWAIPSESGDVSWFQQYRSIKLYGDELLILQLRGFPTRLVYRREGGARQAKVIDDARDLFKSIANGTSTFPPLGKADAVAFVEQRLPRDSWYLQLNEFRRGRAA